MTLVSCPKGHASSDPDWCDVCGAKIAPAGQAQDDALAMPAAAGLDAGSCPDCGTPRTPGSRYCEVCRHDFVTGGGGVGTATAADEQALAPPTPAAVQVEVRVPAALALDRSAAPLAGASQPSATDEPGLMRNAWAVIQCDRSLMRPDEDTPFPDGEPQRSYPLDLEESLVGRRNARRDVHPEIPLNDPSASGRHLKICRRKDGMLVVVDVGSTNGTRLNGVPLDVGVEAPLRHADQLTLGAWTRIRIEAR
jgi:FHA domain